MSQLHVRNIPLATSQAAAGTLLKIPGATASVTVTTADDYEIDVADPRRFYECHLPDCLQMRDLIAAGYRLLPWEELTASQLEQIGRMVSWHSDTPELTSDSDDRQRFAERHRDWLITPR